MPESYREHFKPVPVTGPSASPLKFRLRCLLDLQLATIVQFLRPALASFPRGRILDVGAGQSPWREWLPQGTAYAGLDVANADDFGMTQKADITFYDGRTIPFPDATFDGAICIEVLEHTEDPERVLWEIARVLRPGAPLLLSVPWSARRHHVPFDFHRFTRERLQAMLAGQGFVGVDVRERGDDVAVIANKLLVLAVRIAKSCSLRNFIAAAPLATLFGLFAVLMLVAAHVSLWLGLGSPEDPLGYFCTARRGPHAAT
jgi:SAM-dependent methyltransferase